MSADKCCLWRSARQSPFQQRYGLRKVEKRRFKSLNGALYHIPKLGGFGNANFACLAQEGIERARSFVDLFTEL